MKAASVISPAPMAKMAKFKSLYNPATDQIGNQNKIQLARTTSVRQEAQLRKQEYNKRIAILHPSERKSIKNVPLDKDQFGKVLADIKQLELSADEEDERDNEVLVKARKARFKELFLKHTESKEWGPRE